MPCAGHERFPCTFVRITNLTPGKQYLFAVVGYDEAGAYSPVFSLNENLLQMYVTFASVIGPRIRVYNTIIDYTYPGGGYTLDPLRWIPVEVPAGQVVVQGARRCFARVR